MPPALPSGLCGHAAQHLQGHRPQCITSVPSAVSHQPCVKEPKLAEAKGPASSSCPHAVKIADFLLHLENLSEHHMISHKAERRRVDGAARLHGRRTIVGLATPQDLHLFPFHPLNFAATAAGTSIAICPNSFARAHVNVFNGHPVRTAAA